LTSQDGHQLSAGQHFVRIGKDPLHQFLKSDKVLIPEKDIIDAALALLPQSGIIRLRRSQTVAAEGLNNIVDQIGAGGHQHIHMLSSDQPGDDLSHSRWYHRAGYRQEPGAISGEHLLIDGHGFREPSRPKAALSHTFQQGTDAHTRL